MNRCFVIGPIGDKLAPFGTEGRERYEEALEVYEKVIMPACAENDLSPVRADQIALSGEITEQVFRHLFDDEVVIADVSGANPNVMYELGLRHTRDLLTIHIGEYGQLPFDTNAVRTTLFSRSERGLIDARKQLARSLSEGLLEGSDMLTATRVWTQRNGAIEPIEDLTVGSAGMDSGAVDDEDEGFLDTIEKVEAQFPRLGETAENIGRVIEAMGVTAEEAAREMDSVNSTGAPTAARLTVVRRFSEQLAPSADELTQTVDAFAGDMKELSTDVTRILRFFGEQQSSIGSESTEFLSAVVDLSRTARESLEGLGEFGAQVDGLGKLSKALRRPARQISSALRTMVGSVALMDQWESEALRLQASGDVH